jgi:hypothetical protein
MPHPGAPALLLRVGDHERSTGLVRSGSVRAGLAQRARIVLLASEGVRNARLEQPQAPLHLDQDSGRWVCGSFLDEMVCPVLIMAPPPIL